MEANYLMKVKNNGLIRWMGKESSVFRATVLIAKMLLSTEISKSNWIELVEVKYKFINII